MKREAVLKGSFFISLAIIIFGAALKITHQSGAETLLTIGLVTGLLFMTLAIYEVNTSSKIDRFEKIMWTVGFLFMGTIAGIIYLLAGRKRVVD